jgi:hypothetical protein
MESNCQYRIEQVPRERMCGFCSLGFFQSFRRLSNFKFLENVNEKKKPQKAETASRFYLQNNTGITLRGRCKAVGPVAVASGDHGSGALSQVGDFYAEHARCGKHVRFSGRVGPGRVHNVPPDGSIDERVVDHACGHDVHVLWQPVRGGAEIPADEVTRSGLRDKKELGDESVHGGLVPGSTRGHRGEVPQLLVGQDEHPVRDVRIVRRLLPLQLLPVEDLSDTCESIVKGTHAIGIAFQRKTLAGHIAILSHLPSAVLNGHDKTSMRNKLMAEPTCLLSADQFQFDWRK